MYLYKHLTTSLHILGVWGSVSLLSSILGPATAMLASGLSLPFINSSLTVKCVITHYPADTFDNPAVWLWQGSTDCCLRSLSHMHTVAHPLTSTQVAHISWQNTSWHTFWQTGWRGGNLDLTSPSCSYSMCSTCLKKYGKRGGFPKDRRGKWYWGKGWMQGRGRRKAGCKEDEEPRDETIKSRSIRFK